MARYRKKPIIVEAEQFWPDKKPWPDSVKLYPTGSHTFDRRHYYIKTLEGVYEVTPGDWIITGIKGEVSRTYLEECREPVDLLQKVVGVRVGPGVLKIIKGLIGDATDCKQLAFMVEECCLGIILSFTKDAVMASPADESEAKQYYDRMVKENVRLYNRCAAFATGSSLVEGLESP